LTLTASDCYIAHVLPQGPLAQLAEQQPFKLWVTGSIPVRLIINNRIIMVLKRLYTGAFLNFPRREQLQ
jgi:hypothetical protein